MSSLAKTAVAIIVALIVIGVGAVVYNAFGAIHADELQNMERIDQ